MCEQVNADALLHDHIAAIPVVSEDISDRRYCPLRLTCRGRNTFFRQDLCDFIWGFSSEIKSKDPDDNAGFLFINDEFVVHTLIPIGLDHLWDSFRKALSDPPSDTDGFVHTLVLRKGCENGQEQFAVLR